jgi:NADPH:quinone reductase-like Zn-dependent oxidoreductase
LSDLDAACILYAGLTAWSGLFLSARIGGLSGICGASGAAKGKKVLVLGGAGGVGQIAIQILLAENARVMLLYVYHIFKQFI